MLGIIKGARLEYFKPEPGPFNFFNLNSLNCWRRGTVVCPACFVYLTKDGFPYLCVSPISWIRTSSLTCFARKQSALQRADKKRARSAVPRSKNFHPKSSARDRHVKSVV